MSETKITRQTLIPIGLMITIIASVITVVWFTANLNSKTELCCNQAEANTEDIKELPTKEMYSNMDKKLDMILSAIIKDKDVSIKANN